MLRKMLFGNEWWSNNFIFIRLVTWWCIYNHWFKFSLLFSSARMAQTLFGLGNRFCIGIFSPNCLLNSGFCASSLNMRANLSWDAFTNETNTLWFSKFWQGYGDSKVTSMLVTDVGDQMCWSNVETKCVGQQLVTRFRCWWPIEFIEKITNITKNVGNIMIQPPTSEISHQHNDVTNITVTTNTFWSYFEIRNRFSWERSDWIRTILQRPSKAVFK